MRLTRQSTTVSAMVYAPTLLLLGLSAVSSSLASHQSVPAYEVPSFDYSTLRSDGTPSRVLAAFEAGGMIALRNIPNYAAVRERYLASAVDCALAVESDKQSEHLSTKLFADGTRRLTLRANAGRGLEQLVESPKLAAKCPGYHNAHQDFSRTLERAVESFAAALDDTPFQLSDGARVLSSRSLFREAERLDNFHAYEATTTPREESTMRDLSLLLHEDHGMFIAMSAPEFFHVDASGHATRRQLVSDDSGLVVRKADDKSIVRPVLKDDELVLMAGTGFTKWLEGTHEIPAVMHGMRMPEELVGTQAKGSRHLRAWFGKMTLLPLHQRMLQQGVAFDEFANRTSRHLKMNVNGEESNDLKTVGCGEGRRLVVSEGSCLFRLCKPRPGFNPFPSCASQCNYEYPSQKQVDSCNTKCECTGTTTNAGMCWMTCAAWLPEEECPLDRQTCTGLVMKCTPEGLPVSAQPTAAPHEMPPQLTYHPVTEPPAPTLTPATPAPALTPAAPEPPVTTPPTPPVTTVAPEPQVTTPPMPPVTTAAPETPVTTPPSSSTSAPVATSPPRPQC